jgi:hypothetical protein
MASDALDQLDQTHLELEAAHARLSLGEALGDVGRYREAGVQALKALEFFEPRQITEAVWRGHLVAAAAAGRDDSTQHLKAARAAMEKLKSTWPAGDVARYLERPNIRAAVSKL